LTAPPGGPYPELRRLGPAVSCCPWSVAQIPWWIWSGRAVGRRLLRSTARRTARSSPIG